MKNYCFNIFRIIKFEFPGRKFGCPGAKLKRDDLFTYIYIIQYPKYTSKYFFHKKIFIIQHEN